MAAPAYAYEAWEYKITVDSTHDGSIVVTEDGGTPTTVDIPAGDYYPDELRSAFETALNSALTGTYTVALETPTASQLAGKQGISITASGLSTSLSIAVSSGAADTSPQPEEWLGWGDVVTVTGIAQGSDFVCVSPYTVVGLWVPREPRVSAEPRPERIVTGSTRFTERTDFYVVNRGTRARRLYRYREIPAARVFKSRGNLAAYAATAEIGTGDRGDAFEWMWERLSAGEAVKVTWFSASQALDANGADTDTETVYLDGIDSGAVLGDLINLQRLSGEYYEIQVPVVISSTEVDY